MNSNYIEIDKNLIKPTSKIIASEFISSPVVSYIFPEDSVKEKILPLVFENLLNIYQQVGTTYATSKNIEFTFSLVNASNALHNFSLYTTLLKCIPKTLQVALHAHIIDASKRIIHTEQKLKEALDFVMSQEDYFFLSSIAAKDKSTEDLYLDDMIEFAINYAKTKKMMLIVETESMKMVNLYTKHGFTLRKECKLKDSNATIYILSTN